jgi:hypothetical protein
MSGGTRRARWGLGFMAAGCGLLSCLAISARGATTATAPLAGCHERVEGSAPPPAFKGLVAVPGVLRLGLPKRAYVPGRGVATREGMIYKVPAAINAGVPAKTVLLSAVDPRVRLHYGTREARALRLRACKPGTPGFGDNPPVGQWTGWSGGVIVPEVMCVHLLVKEGTRTHHVRFGLGIRCPEPGAR